MILNRAYENLRYFYYVVVLDVWELGNIKDAYLTFNTALPCATIQIGMETPWQIKDNLKIKSIDITSGVENAASLCKIVLEKSHLKYTKGTGGLADNEPESGLVKRGEAITVKLGYTSSASRRMNLTFDVFKGFISSVQISYGREIGTIILECMDAKMWMMAGCKTEGKIGSKYSTVVNSILAQYTKSQKIQKASVAIKQEPNLNRALYQHNESDYDFLCRLADETGCLFFVYLGHACFISVDTYKSITALELSPCGFVENIKWSASVLKLSKQVVVTGIDPLNPNNEVKSKVVIKNISNIGKNSLNGGANPVKNVDASTAKNIINEEVDTAAYAQFMAQADFTKNSIKHIVCEVKISGHPLNSVLLGYGIKVSGWGSQIDNTYILTGIKHTYTKNKFTTELTLATDTG